MAIKDQSNASAVGEVAIPILVPSILKIIYTYKSKHVASLENTMIRNVVFI